MRMFMWGGLRFKYYIYDYEVCLSVCRRAKGKTKRLRSLVHFPYLLPYTVRSPLMIMIMHVVRLTGNCVFVQSAFCSLFHSGWSSSMQESESLSFSLRLHDYFPIFFLLSFCSWSSMLICCQPNTMCESRIGRQRLECYINLIIFQVSSLPICKRLLLKRLCLGMESQ